ncbi:MBL fold metallo-hydrolase [Acidisoma sp.]|uniref:MBL fold metallo-hydrolase n=1 Tax=Acidisoma sp. TaxID=1872115 RepID=UPI003B00D65F
MRDWFVVRRVTRDLWMIAEPGHVVNWLYAGSDRAILVDSGTGIVPIAPVVARLTDRPITVVNTHYHFDHVGGNADFAERLAGVRGGPLLERAAPRDLLRRYLKAFPAIVAGARARVAADPDAFALSPETEVRDFPPDFDPEAWLPGRVPATALLREGDEIGLGDRALRVIDTPGHSPDGICLFDERYGVLFTGDTIMEGALYAHYDESSLPDLRASAAKLAALDAPVHAICAGHIPRAVAETSLIGETVEAVDRVLNGAPHTLAHDVFGYTVRQTRVGRVWVYHSDGAGSSFALHD